MSSPYLSAHNHLQDMRLSETESDFRYRRLPKERLHDHLRIKHSRNKADTVLLH